MTLISKIWTFTLTNDTKTINGSEGLQQLAIKLVSGVGTVTGTKTVGANPSTALTLFVNDPITISINEAIEALIIDCSGGGVIQLIGK